MRALCYDGQLRLVTDYPEPALRPGEAIIRPHLVGICNTDAEITRGYMGFRGILGHEFVGTVVACEESTWLGRRVVGEINAACSTCPTCARGESSHCPHRTTLGIDRRDGAMADRLSLPVSCLHEVPEEVPDEAAVFAEPLAAALQILEQSHIRPSDRVALVGDGKLGLLCAQVLRLTGCELVVVGRHPERWGLLQGQGIATVHGDALDKAAEPSTSRPAGALSPQQRATLAQSFDVVIDCTGRPGGLETARQLIRPRGRLVLKSTIAGDSGLNMSLVVVDEIQIVGSRCGPFAPALRLLQRDLVATEPLIAGRFPLDAGLEAFRAAHGRLKVLLEV